MRELMRKYYGLDFTKSSVPMNYANWLHIEMDESSIDKAITIFNDMFQPEDEIFLVVHSSEGYEQITPRQYRGDISIIEFFISGNYYEENFEVKGYNPEADSHFLVISIAINRKQVKVKPILQEILKTDLGGCSNLASTVFFINRRTHMIYHLYDDRGVDIMAPSILDLKPLYDKYIDQIPKEDKGLMAKIMNGHVITTNRLRLIPLTLTEWEQFVYQREEFNRYLGLMDSIEPIPDDVGEGLKAQYKKLALKTCDKDVFIVWLIVLKEENRGIGICYNQDTKISPLEDDLYCQVGRLYLHNGYEIEACQALKKIEL